MKERGIAEKCREAAAQIRRDVIEMTYSTGKVGAHLGGSLSMAEIFAVLYIDVVQYDPADLEWALRDRVILSKGHAAPALYSALVQAKIIKRDELETFKQNGSQVSAHPSLHGLPGIEFASGSLGQGLSLGVGVGLALKRRNVNARVFVLLGDGECNEGSVWEAAVSAAHFGLDNLVAVVDLNNIQYDGDTKDVMDMCPFAQKWMDFGWSVLEVDGHSVEELLEAFHTKTDKPLVVLAHTVKGKGVSFMEGNWRFHNSWLSSDQYQQAMEELKEKHD